MDGSMEAGGGHERRLSRGGFLKRAGVLGVGASAVGALAGSAPAEVERIVLVEREAGARHSSARASAMPPRA
jgi:hypothetical protein